MCGDSAELWRKRFSDELDSFFKDWVPADDPNTTNTTVLDFLKIPYFPYWSFGERVPVLEQKDPDNPKTLAYSFQPLARSFLGGMDWKEARDGAHSTEEAQRLATELEKARLETAKLAQENQMRAEAKRTAELERQEDDRAERLRAIQARIDEELARWAGLKKWDSRIELLLVASVIPLIAVGSGLFSGAGWILFGFFGWPILVFAALALPVRRVIRREKLAKSMLDGLSAERSAYRSKAAPPYASLDPDAAVTLFGSTVEDNVRMASERHKESASYTWQPAAATPAASAPVPGPIPPPASASAPVEPIASDYLYDLYLSYTHDAQVISDWLDLFLPLLTFWLGEELGRKPEIFAQEMTHPDGLRASRCLLPIFTPTYFRTKTCLAELRSFLAREAEPIFPIYFRMSEHIPDKVRSPQAVDFAQFSFIGESFKGSPRYLDFQKAIQDLAPRLAETICRAPPYNPDAPVISPDEVQLSSLRPSASMAR